jgi:hypothetical protein
LHIHQTKIRQTPSNGVPVSRSLTNSRAASPESSTAAPSASLFAHDFSRIPVFAADREVLQKQADHESKSSAQLNSATAQEAVDVGAVVGDPASSESDLIVKVQIVSGSKPAPNQPEEQPIFGGMKGGHVVINLGADGVLGFTNDSKGAHFFSKRKSKNSKFERYTESQWASKIKDKQVVTFEIHLTAEQRATLQQAFEGEPSVDYSVAGYRCASYALRALEETGVIQASQFSIKYFLAPTPTALIRFLEHQGFKSEVQEGSTRRRWNKRFRSVPSTVERTD